jgi:hypothetical protein
MMKLMPILLLALVIAANASHRDSVINSILMEFVFEIEIDIADTTTHQLISVSDKYNAAKNVQTISYDQNGTTVTKTYTTLALFNEEQIIMKSDDSQTCHYRPIASKINFIQLLRGVFIDPKISPMIEYDDVHQLEFTVDWNMIESMDAFTHIWFDSVTYELKKIEQRIDQSESAWLEFNIVKPIKKASHSKGDFVIPGCGNAAHVEDM